MSCLARSCEQGAESKRVFGFREPQPWVYVRSKSFSIKPRSGLRARHKLSQSLSPSPPLPSSLLPISQLSVKTAKARTTAASPSITKKQRTAPPPIKHTSRSANPPSKLPTKLQPLLSPPKNAHPAHHLSPTLHRQTPPKHQNDSNKPTQNLFREAGRRCQRCEDGRLNWNAVCVGCGRRGTE